jgi:accessory colonization factor AcfC
MDRFQATPPEELARLKLETAERFGTMFLEEAFTLIVDQGGPSALTKFEDLTLSNLESAVTDDVDERLKDSAIEWLHKAVKAALGEAAAPRELARLKLETAERFGTMFLEEAFALIVEQGGPSALKKFENLMTSKVESAVADGVDERLGDLAIEWLHKAVKAALGEPVVPREPGT